MCDFRSKANFNSLPPQIMWFWYSTVIVCPSSVISKQNVVQINCAWFWYIFLYSNFFFLSPFFLMKINIVYTVEGFVAHFNMCLLCTFLQISSLSSHLSLLNITIKYFVFNCQCNKSNIWLCYSGATSTSRLSFWLF